MSHNKLFGKLGEDYATLYLLKNKYKIIARNYRCKLGEIDIIVKNKNTLIFVEVKARKNTRFGNAVEAITQEKQKHIYNTALYYISNNSINYEEIRFDAIEVYINKGIKINHIKGIIN